MCAYQFLKDVFGKKITSNLKNMEYWEKTAGESMEEEDESEFPAGLDYQPGSGVRVFLPRLTMQLVLQRSESCGSWTPKTWYPDTSSPVETM